VVAATQDVDVVVVGAGFSGMYAVYLIRGLGLSVQGFDAASDVGGTWYWNRYPGARCDIESMDYSYSFSEELQQEWEWTQQYPTQPEMLSYARHVAERFDLKRHFEFETRVEQAVYDEGTGRWHVRTGTGRTVSARYCIMATGVLSAVKFPDFKGIDDFAGEKYLTAQWPHDDASFAGKRVAVIGTGSSGIQCVPVIAEEAERLYVFQRTANFSIPGINVSLDPAKVTAIKSSFAEFRAIAKTTRDGTHLKPNLDRTFEVSPEERTRVFEERWRLGGFAFLSCFADMRLDMKANDVAADFVRDKIRSIVKDPSTAELLCPKTHPLGTKRICVDTNYYATFNRENVELIDISADPIEEITSAGLRTGGLEFEVDAIVFAIGFDAMTGALTRMDIRGRGGISLRDHWSEGPRTYLGLTASGFPNLFMVVGPGSPSVLTNMFVAIEQHVEWIAGCIANMREHSYREIEATGDAEQQWMKHIDELAGLTLHNRANSWYRGVNIPGKPQVFMPYIGGMDAYRRECDEVVADGYRGYLFS
jgi:cyclohexanone monooxygenase